jgi:hypothetical protein
MRQVSYRLDEVSGIAFLLLTTILAFDVQSSGIQSEVQRLLMSNHQVFNQKSKGWLGV